MKMFIKSLLAVGMIGMSAAAFSATGCAGAGADASITSAANSFIVNTFTLKCSANVFLNYDATTTSTQVGVCAASSKGNAKYGGSSEGGKVQQSGGALTGAITQTTPAVGAAGCS